MNEIGVRLAWCAIQVSLVSLVAIAFLSVVAKRGRGELSTIGVTSLLVIVTLSLSAWSSWPRWTWGALAQRDASARGASDNREREPGALDNRTNKSKANTWMVDFVESLSSELRLSPRTSGDFSSTDSEFDLRAQRLNESWRWPTWFGVVVIGLGIVGVIRLFGGWWSVRSLARKSLPISDRRLLEEIDIVCAMMSCRVAPSARELAMLPTAATVGWREPLILLPTDWRKWSPEELRSVLAHEIAHITRQDYLANGVAQLGLSLHFYNPFVHSLVNWLRSELELAADAAAARVVGPHAYLESVAKLALRQSDCSLGWPARTFLPTRGTLLRRLEMLRNWQFAPGRLDKGARWAGIILLVAAWIGASGLRAGADPTIGIDNLSSVIGQTTTSANNASPGNEQNKSNGETPPNVASNIAPVANRFEWIPGDACLVGSINLAEVSKQPALFMITRSYFGENLGLPVEDAGQLTISLHPLFDVRHEPLVLVMHLNKALEFAGTKQVKREKATERSFFGITYYENQGASWYQPDDRTVIVAPEPLLKLAIVSGKDSKVRLLESPLWYNVKSKPLVAIADVQFWARMLNSDKLNEPWVASFSPLWQHTHTAALGVSFEKGISAELHGLTGSKESADRVQSTAIAAVTLAKNMLSANKAHAVRVLDGEKIFSLPLNQMAFDLVDSAKVTVSPDFVVSVSTSISQNDTAIRALAMAGATARSAARRTNGMNNLKQIMLAMHNFNDTYTNFPAAKSNGKNGNGGPPHSWRVDLLPYVDAAALYNEYRFDEPWDSEANKRVLAKMPAIYRAPGDDPNSTNTSYFAIVGPHTLFGKEKGTKMVEITDGTSNTIAIVESKQAIPWTKPEDIGFDPDKPLPVLGGWHDQGFNAGFGDGSVRFIAKSIEERILRMLITIDDGQVLPAF